MKSKTVKPKKFLCIVCGRIFISALPMDYVCTECTKELKQLSEESKNHETKH